MANHVHDDPYYPVAGDGWFEGDPEEGYETASEGETEEEVTGPHVDHPLPSSDDSIWDGSDTGTDESETMSEHCLLHIMSMSPPISTPQDTPPPPRWASQLHDWSREQGLPRPLGTSRAYFDLSTSTTADRALPVMVGRVSNLDARVETISRQLANAVISAADTTTQMHRISAYQHFVQEEVQALRMELAAAKAVIDTLQERMTEFEQRAIAAEASAAVREEQARIATRSTAEMSARLAHHYGI